MSQARSWVSAFIMSAIAMARRNGWTAAVQREDQCCPHAAFVLGFVPGKGYLDGSYAEAVGLSPKERSSKLARHVSRLDFGKYNCMLAAPPQNTTFQPDVVVVYGNPAQVLRPPSGQTRHHYDFYYVLR